MRKTRTVVVVLCFGFLTFASCAGKIEKLDREIDYIESEIVSLDAKQKAGETTPEEDARLAKLWEARDTLYYEREEERKKQEAAGGLAGTALGLIGAIFGIPLLIGAGSMVKKSLTSKKREKKPLV